MIFNRFISTMIGRGEARIGVNLDYVREIAETSFGLLRRYNRIFGFLDPNKHTPADAYHTARLRGAVAMDCGTCVLAEINLAKTAGVSRETLDHVLAQNYDALPDALAAVARLADSVVSNRKDAPEARALLREAYGDAGLIELSFAMTGAAALPTIKRAMGHSVACDLAVMRRVAKAQGAANG